MITFCEAFQTVRYLNLNNLTTFKTKQFKTILINKIYFAFSGQNENN